jgi:hypothetical protein
MQRHELLERVPRFKGVPNSARMSLAERLVERRFRAGELVFNKGDRGNALFWCWPARWRSSCLPRAGPTPSISRK